MQVELWMGAQGDKKPWTANPLHNEGPKPGGQVNANRDRVGAKNSQALGLWVSKSSDSFVHTPPRVLSRLCVTVNNGFTDQRYEFHPPMGNLGLNQEGNLVWPHVSGMYGGSQARLQSAHWRSPLWGAPSQQLKPPALGVWLPDISCEWSEWKFSYRLSPY